MSPEIGAARWQSLETQAPARGLLEGVAAQSGRDELIAIDHEGARHLLLPILDDTRGHVDRRSRGISATVERLAVGLRSPQLFIDLRCTEVMYRDAFDVVIRDVLEMRRQGLAASEAVRLTLGRWRRFWGSAPTQALNRERQGGLIGELWFLATWLLPRDGRAVTHWLGPQGAHHDFQWPAAAVEVKATLSEGHVHRINGLGQLQPAPQSELYLFSVRLRQELAGTITIPGLIVRVTQSLSADAQQLDLFETRLAEADYNPVHDDEYAANPVTVLDSRLFRVADTMPRLTEASFVQPLAPGLLEVGYVIDLGVCMDLVVATEPEQLPEVLLDRG